MQMEILAPPGLTACFAGCLQFSVEAAAPERNLASVVAGLNRFAATAPGLIVLPELWATGFAYDRLPELARQTPEILAELQKLARLHRLHLAGSLPEEQVDDAGRSLFYNTLFLTGPDGTLGYYRKQRLFAPMAEDLHFTAGNNPLPLDTPFARVGALVCYDLRFPELARHQAARGAEIFVISAQWPLVRLAHWRALVQARAIENQAYVIACNRCGATGDTEFGGHSLIVAPDGTILTEAGAAEEAVGLLLDPETLTTTRSRFNTAGPNPFSFSDSRKVKTSGELSAIRRRCRRLGQKMVFTNGCFDILHAGHATYLEAARRQGDCLVVGLNSDASVRALKGPSRPVNREEDRARLLAALGCVDYVVLFSEEDPQRLIEELLPDVLVKGADWPIERIVGAREVLTAGGKVINIPLVADLSTTSLISRIKGEP
jgi:D-glycero-beta-D-manno-heptose 1-phosphate adenylyltransferase